MKEPVFTIGDVIEIRHLRYFIAAAEHGSFRKAGSALGLSQSAISRCIANLEDHIGAALFHRHTWGVSQTFAGERFLATARKAIRTVGEGVIDVAAAGRGENGHVRIGIYSSIASGFLTALLERYGERHPNVRFDLIEGRAEEHVAAIRRLLIDVAFLAGQPKWSECDCQHLWSERVFVALPDSHSLVRKSALTWLDLTSEFFIVSEVAPGEEVHAHLVRELTALGRQPSIQVQAVGLDNLLPLVALGRGLTLVCEAMTVAHFPGVSYRPIVDEILPFSAIWSANNDNPAFRRLLSLAKAMALRPVPAIPDQSGGPSQNRDPSR